MSLFLQWMESFCQSPKALKIKARQLISFVAGSGAVHLCGIKIAIMDKFLLLAALLLLTWFAHAQPVIKAGDPSIRYDLIQPGVQTYRYTIVDSAGKTVNEFTCQHTVSVNMDKGWVILTQDNQLPGGRRLLDSTIADLRTLSPVRMRMVTTPNFMSMELDFKAQAVHAIAEKGGHQTDTIHHMEAGYFDSNLLEYLFGLLPYKEGFKATINTYTFERKGMDPFVVEYVGEEVLTAPNGQTTHCYIVKTGSAGKAPDAKLWIEKTTGKVVKHVVPMGKMTYVITKV